MNRSGTAIRRRQRQRARRARGIKRIGVADLYDKLYRHIRQAQEVMPAISSRLGRNPAETRRARDLLDDSYGLLSSAAKKASESLRAVPEDVRLGR